MARKAKTGTEAVDAINERIQEYSLSHYPEKGEGRLTTAPGIESE